MNPTTTVGQLVVENPNRARIFESLGIDFCCGGKKTISEVCAAKGLDAATLLAVLAASEQGPLAVDPTDWSHAPLAQLCQHIVQTHHAYLKRELPRLHPLVAKVANRHGPAHPEMFEVLTVFGAFREELEQHMVKEERILFPLIAQREQGNASPSHCGGIDRPISVMEHEHDSAGRALERMRELTHGYAAPEGACNTYRAVLASLAQIEADMHQHVHKENNILFPRAIAAERELCGAVD